MKNLTQYLFALSFTTASLAATHGIHHKDPNSCEEICSPDEPDERAWYRRQEYQEFGPYEDPTPELDDDTAWPGQREDFSDTLFR